MMHINQTHDKCRVITSVAYNSEKPTFILTLNHHPRYVSSFLFCVAAKGNWPKKLSP